MRGAREVRKAIVDDARVAALKPIVVWIPMLPDDDRAAAEDMAKLFADRPIPQFWDAETLLGKEVNRSLGVATERAAWDIYLFYPPGAEWTDAGMPAPAKALAQSMNVVIGAKGTLPPKGDQSHVPAWAVERADVVGDQAELGALLTQVALPFVAGDARTR